MQRVYSKLICKWCKEPIPVYQEGDHHRPCETLNYAIGETGPDGKIRYCESEMIERKSNVQQ